MRYRNVLAALTLALASGVVATPSQAQTCDDTCSKQYAACPRDPADQIAGLRCSISKLSCQDQCQINDLRNQLREVTADRDRLLRNPAVKQAEQERWDRQRQAEQERLDREAEGNPEIQYRCGRPGVELRADHICVYDPTTVQDCGNNYRSFRTVGTRCVDAETGNDFPNRTACLPNEHVVQQSPLRCGYRDVQVELQSGRRVQTERHLRLRSHNAAGPPDRRPLRQ
jgi:hypothetical protein